VFTVDVAATKLQVKRHLESLYGITVDRVNMVRMAGKIRRYGKSVGRTKAFKKAIVTLTKDSKKPESLEVA
jgi:large subunit ribosomal protein L23